MTAVVLAAFPLANSTPVLVALSALAGLQLMFWPIVFTYIPPALPDAVQGSGFGFLRTLFIALGATGPVVVGALADARLFDGAFTLLAGVTLVAIPLAVVLPTVTRGEGQ